MNSDFDADLNAGAKNLQTMLRYAERFLFFLGGVVLSTIAGALLMPVLKAMTSAMCLDSPPWKMGAFSMCPALATLAIAGTVAATLALFPAFFVAERNQQVRKLVSNVGTTVTYVEELYPEPQGGQKPRARYLRSHYKGKVHRAIARVVRSAQKEILVLTDIFTEAEPDVANHRARGLVLREYEKVIQRHKRENFIYTRIIQVPKKDAPDPDGVRQYVRHHLGSATTRHCRNVLATKDRLGWGVAPGAHPDLAILAMHVQRPVTLVIVDRRYIAIITEAPYRGDPARPAHEDGPRYLAAALIVEDRSGKLGLGLRYHRYFENFRDNAYRIGPEDLPPPPAGLRKRLFPRERRSHS